MKYCVFIDGNPVKEYALQAASERYARKMSICNENVIVRGYEDDLAVSLDRYSQGCKKSCDECLWNVNNQCIKSRRRITSIRYIDTGCPHWDRKVTEEQNTWGGARPGSGRKAVEEKRVQMNITIAPITKERLLAERDKGHRIGRLIDELVEGYCSKEE